MDRLHRMTIKVVTVSKLDVDWKWGGPVWAGFLSPGHATSTSM